jgi:hypothetical protein
MTIFSYAQLEQIWTSNGGSAAFAPIAAAISMAESGGNSDAVGSNANGSVDRGLWQINSSNGSLSTTDINGNARAAIQMSNNGTNWRPWCTAYSDGACGTNGGSFLGSGSPYQKYLSGGDATTQGQSQVGGNGTLTASTSSCVFPSGGKINIHLPLYTQTISICLWEEGWSRAAFGAFFFMLALATGITGITLLATSTKTFKGVQQLVTKQAGRAAEVALIA